MASTTIAHQLAEGVLAKTITDDTRSAAFNVFLDTVAGISAGSGRAEHSAMRALLGRAGGSSTVVGSTEPVPIADAVLLNGTTPTVYQLDEGYRVSRGHPGIHVVPAVWAIAEDIEASYNDLISALIVGYEVAARVGASLGGSQADIHPHGNWGTIGAAAGAAYLWSSGDLSTVAVAIDMAASITLYPDRTATTLGAGVHHLFAAEGAHIGTIAAAAAQAGMTAVPGSLENFMMRRSGAAPQPAAVVHGLTDASAPWSIDGNYFKFWAACGHTHTAIGALLAARERSPFLTGDVERINVRAFRAAASLGTHDVDNDLAARYSIPYVVAAGVVKEGFPYDVLDGATVHDPAVRTMADRVSVEYDASLDSGYPAHGRPLSMSIILRDGTVIEQETALSFGDSEYPATDAALQEKAASLLTMRFGRESSARILASANALRNGGAVRSLGDSFREAAREATPANGGMK